MRGDPSIRRRRRGEILSRAAPGGEELMPALRASVVSKGRSPCCRYRPCPGTNARHVRAAPYRGFRAPRPGRIEDLADPLPAQPHWDLLADRFRPPSVAGRQPTSRAPGGRVYISGAPGPGGAAPTKTAAAAAAGLC